MQVGQAGAGHQGDAGDAGAWFARTLFRKVARSWQMPTFRNGLGGRFVLRLHNKTPEDFRAFSLVQG